MQVLQQVNLVCNSPKEPEVVAATGVDIRSQEGQSVLRPAAFGMLVPLSTYILFPD